MATTATTRPAWPALGDAHRAALRVLLVEGPLPRAEIAQSLGLSRASMTRVARGLIEGGIVEEGGSELRARTGRPSEMLRIRPDATHFFGVKLTGDAAFAVMTDLSARVVASESQPLRARDVPVVIAQIGEIFDRMRTRFPAVAAAGLSVAGDIARIDGHALVIDSSFLGWDQVPLAEIAAERLGIPVTAENDVRALTAAEHWFGAGAGCDSFALVTVGAGTGLGFVTSGDVVAGRTGRAGRIDHLPVDGNGPICGLGHRGCVSAYLTNQAIVDALRLPGLAYTDAVELARSGNPAALRAFEDAARALGLVVATVANILDPERIVLTGDGLALMELAEPHVRDAMYAQRLPKGAPVPLVVRPFEFSQWARAGAVTGIRSLLRIT